MRLQDALEYHARRTPDLDFAIDGDRTLSYGEAELISNRIANALIAEGLQLGDRVGYLSKNSADYILFYYGAAKAGLAPVPLNYRLAAPEWAYILSDSGAKLLFSQNEFAAAVDSVRGELAGVREYLCTDAAGPAGWIDAAAWIDTHPDSKPEREIDEAMDLYQMYTSGTTGRPKGAVLTHRAVVSNVEQFQMAMPVGPGDRVLIVAPVYHAAAAVTAFLTTYGGAALFLQSDFIPAEAVRALSEEGITRALLVPAMIQACLVMVPDVAERNYDALRSMTYGASPIAEQTLARAIEVFGCDFAQGYGMTETTAALTFLMPDDHRRAMAGEPKLLLSAGRPLPGTDVKIVDDDGNRVASGTVGEICGKGPQLMTGYWNLPEATAQALRDSWMYTGDAGIIDEQGYVFIQDRVKDMIVSGGENVYPREIEDALYKHPAIAEAAVIGVPDERWGESVKAIVVLKKGATAAAEDIVAHCKGLLAGYKQPRTVDFIDELPRNPSGKVLKKDLREPYWRGHTRRVS